MKTFGETVREAGMAAMLNWALEAYGAAYITRNLNLQI